MTLCSRLKNQVGFTLIEMAVAVIIIGISLSIAAGVEICNNGIDDDGFFNTVQIDSTGQITNSLLDNFEPACERNKIDPKPYWKDSLQLAAG